MDWKNHSHLWYRKQNRLQCINYFQCMYVCVCQYVFFPFLEAFVSRPQFFTATLLCTKDILFPLCLSLTFLKIVFMDEKRDSEKCTSIQYINNFCLAKESSIDIWIVINVLFYLNLSDFELKVDRKQTWWARKMFSGNDNDLRSISYKK